MTETRGVTAADTVVTKSSPQTKLWQWDSDSLFSYLRFEREILEERCGLYLKNSDHDDCSDSENNSSLSTAPCSSVAVPAYNEVAPRFQLAKQQNNHFRLYSKKEVAFLRGVRLRLMLRKLREAAEEAVREAESAALAARLAEEGSEGGGDTGADEEVQGAAEEAEGGQGEREVEVNANTGAETAVNDNGEDAGGEVEGAVVTTRADSGAVNDTADPADSEGENSDDIEDSDAEAGSAPEEEQIEPELIPEVNFDEVLDLTRSTSLDPSKELPPSLSQSTSLFDRRLNKKLYAGCTSTVDSENPDSAANKTNKRSAVPSLGFLCEKKIINSTTAAVSRISSSSSKLTVPTILSFLDYAVFYDAPLLANFCLLLLTVQDSRATVESLLHGRAQDGVQNCFSVKGAKVLWLLDRFRDRGGVGRRDLYRESSEFNESKQLSKLSSSTTPSSLSLQRTLEMVELECTRILPGEAINNLKLNLTEKLKNLIGEGCIAEDKQNPVRKEKGKDTKKSAAPKKRVSHTETAASKKKVPAVVAAEVTTDPTGAPAVSQLVAVAPESTVTTNFNAAPRLPAVDGPAVEAKKAPAAAAPPQAPVWTEVGIQGRKKKNATESTITESLLSKPVLPRPVPNPIKTPTELEDRNAKYLITERPVTVAPTQKSQASTVSSNAFSDALQVAVNKKKQKAEFSSAGGGPGPTANLTGGAFSWGNVATSDAAESDVKDSSADSKPCEKSLAEIMASESRSKKNTTKPVSSTSSTTTKTTPTTTTSTSSSSTKDDSHTRNAWGFTALPSELKNLAPSGGLQSLIEEEKEHERRTAEKIREEEEIAYFEQLFKAMEESELVAEVEQAEKSKKGGTKGGGYRSGKGSRQKGKNQSGAGTAKSGSGKSSSKSKSSNQKGGGKNETHKKPPDKGAGKKGGTGKHGSTAYSSKGTS